MQLCYTHSGSQRDVWPHKSFSKFQVARLIGIGRFADHQDNWRARMFDEVIQVGERGRRQEMYIPDQIVAAEEGFFDEEQMMGDDEGAEFDEDDFNE